MQRELPHGQERGDARQGAFPAGEGEGDEEDAAEAQRERTRRYRSVGGEEVPGGGHGDADRGEDRGPQHSQVRTGSHGRAIISPRAAAVNGRSGSAPPGFERPLEHRQGPRGRRGAARAFPPYGGHRDGAAYPSGAQAIGKPCVEPRGG
ncbi:hypothetical protein ACWV95_18705 [Streptomyces albus]